MHYTSIQNIHKVIDPLFLDELKAEFEEIKQYKTDKKITQECDAFQNKLATLKFLDPACGSGNFLTETYICLRKLENEVILFRSKGMSSLSLEELNPVKVSIHQFYGIEINDFACAVATTALWIAESQMLHETEEIIHRDIDFLPLKSNSNIVEGNALRMDWNEVIPASELTTLWVILRFVVEDIDLTSKLKMLLLFLNLRISIMLHAGINNLSYTCKII